MSKTQHNIQRGISIVFEEINKTISAVGEKNFLDILKQSREDKHLTYQNKLVKRIIKVVSKEFDIPPKELLYGNSRLNDKTHAIGIIAYILTKHHNFTLKETSLILNKNNTNLSRYKKEVENYDPNHLIDMERIEKFESIKHQLKLIEQYEQEERN